MALMRYVAEKQRAAAAPRTMAIRPLNCGSQLSWQVAVDLEADADLEKGWGRPRHCRSLFIRIHRFSP
jgi:hypothetical protein